MAAFQTKTPPSNNSLGASMAPGQSASPPGDALTSQLPVKVYTGNKKPFIPHPGYCILLTNSSQKGYFTSNLSAGSFGVRAVPLNPLTWNAGPQRGGPNGGQTGGELKKAKKTRMGVIRNAKEGMKGESVEEQQRRTGRQATARSFKKGSGGSSHPLPSATLKKRIKKDSMYSKSVVPKKLGGGTLVRKPLAG